MEQLKEKLLTVDPISLPRAMRAGNLSRMWVARVICERWLISFKADGNELCHKMATCYCHKRGLYLHKQFDETNYKRKFRALEKLRRQPMAKSDMSCGQA